MAADMWAIVTISLGLFTGPQPGVVLEAGTFSDEAACNAAITASVPAKLDKNTEKLWRDGYRRFVCVRAQQPGD